MKSVQIELFEVDIPPIPLSPNSSTKTPPSLNRYIVQSLSTPDPSKRLSPETEFAGLSSSAHPIATKDKANKIFVALLMPHESPMQLI